MINQTRNRNESERIASRRGGRKKYHGKNQVRPPVGREKQSVGRWGVGAGVGGGGRCGGRALGGRACAQTAGGAAGAARSPAAHSQRPRRSSPASRSAPPVRAPLASTPRRALTALAAGSVRAAAAAAARFHVVPTTLHVQSAKVSASDCDRESDPAADLRAGPELHAAQG